MAKANPPPTSDEFYSKMMTDDSLHIIVEGTIIIESELRAILDLLFLRPKALDEADLNYSQQVSLAYAMGIDEQLVKPLRVLGTIRNKYAHKLMPEIDRSLVKNLLDAMSPRERGIVHNQWQGMRNRAGEKGFQAPAFSNLSPPMQFVVCIIVLRVALTISRHRLIAEGAIRPL